MQEERCDVVIVGGGVMGSSVAYHLLAADPRLKVAVIERDPTYLRASTSLCLGGVRVQFSLRENILISLYAREFLSRFGEEMAVEGEKPPGMPPQVAAEFQRRAGGVTGPRGVTGAPPAAAPGPPAGAPTGGR